MSFQNRKRQHDRDTQVVLELCAAGVATVAIIVALATGYLGAFCAGLMAVVR